MEPGNVLPHVAAHRELEMTYTGAGFAALGASALLFACATDTGPFFTPPEIPENQLAFDNGKIGLLTPALSKENELIAFRLLSGLKMDPVSAPAGSGKDQLAGSDAWLEKRKTIQDPPAPVFINAYRTKSSGDQYVYYENCLGDAFLTAMHTLEDRRVSYGSAAAIGSWAAAQDRVFANCSGDKPTYPDPLPGTASSLQRADRDYQIAAAHFYAEDFAEAERRFRTIAKDPSTPWRHVASYMVARTLLREASLQNNAAALPKAREQLMQISGDQSAAPLDESARRLLEHVDAVEHPHTTLESLSARLSAPQPPAPTLEDAINQSAFVLRATSFQTELAKPDVPEAFDWVQTLEKGDSDHAFQCWRSRNSLPWLTLALMYSTGKDSVVPELLTQADALPRSSPAFGTASYNAIRLSIERGDASGARAKLDRLLDRTNGQSDSLVNAWRSERMRVATSFDDLLRWAPRKPVGAKDYYVQKANVDSEILAEDSAYVLNYLTPLAKLNHAAHSKLLPAWSAADVALAGWTRAFMLNDLDTARELALIVAKEHSDWQSSMVPETGAQADHWKFQAALLIALHHQFQPSVRVNYRTELNTSGSWWCPVETQTAAPGNGDTLEIHSISWRLPVVFAPLKQVFSQADRDAASHELSELHEKGSTEMFLAPIIFQWAKAHPDDPQVPEALHRLVVVTRYGCRNGDPAIGQISKAAFDQLHERYPKNQWTAQTPYWFK
jgi:TolA-binding protein